MKFKSTLIASAIASIVSPAVFALTINDSGGIPVVITNNVIVTNAGTINLGGMRTDAAISAELGSSLLFVENAGDIIGTVDFGFGFGEYRFAGGRQDGDIINAGNIRLQTFGMMGVNQSDFEGDFTYNGNIIVDAIASLNQQNPMGDAIIDHGLLSVNGDVNVTGATVIVNVTGDELIQANQTFDFLSASGMLVSDATTALDNSAILDFAVEAVNDDGNALRVRASIVELEAIADPEALDELGLDSDSRGFDNIGSVYAKIFDDIVPNIESLDLPESSELQAVITLLQSLPTAAAVIEAVESLDPETVEAASLSAQAADAAAAATVSNRLIALRDEYGLNGVAAGDPMTINGFWVQAYDNEADQDVRDNVDGFDTDTYGVAVGFDTSLDENTTAGLAVSFADTDVEMKQSDSELEIASYRLTAYGGYTTDTYYVDGQLAYAYNDYESERNVIIGSGGTGVAKSDYSGDQYTLRLRAGMPKAYDNGFFVTPMVTMDYTYLREEEYKEKGIGNLGLDASPDDVEALIVGVGVKVAYAFTTSNEYTWVPEVSIEAMHDLIGDEVEIDSNFIGVSGAAFVTQGADNEQEMYKASIKLRGFSQGKTSFSIGYDYLEKQDYDSQSLVATVRYDF